MKQEQWIHLIEKAYFSQLPFSRWKDTAWNWNLEMVMPGGGGAQWGEFREYFRWPNHLLTEFIFKDGKIVNFFDGTKAWDGTYSPKPIDADRFMISIRLRNLVNDLVAGKIKILKLDENSGTFTLDFGENDQPQVTFDPKSGYLLRYEGPSRAMGRPNVSTFEWSDYEIRNGIPAPGKQDMLLNGVVFQRRTLKDFKINPGHVVVGAGIILKDNSILMARRREKDHLGGFWEFPGGKIHDGENLEQCLARELKEELGVEARVNNLFFSTVHEYPEKIVHLHFFLCDILSGEPKPHASEELKWIEIKNLTDYPLPPADKELVEKLKKEIGHGHR